MGERKINTRNDILWIKVKSINYMKMIFWLDLFVFR